MSEKPANENLVHSTEDNSHQETIFTAEPGLLSFVFICIGSGLAPLLIHSSTLGIPAMASELALDARAISWFPLALVIGNAISQFPAARLADRFGRKRFFSLGLCLAGIASLLGGSATTGLIIISARFLQGMGNAIIFATGLALISDLVVESRRSRMLGVYLACCYIGITSGPLLGGVILQHFGWRAVFYFPAPVLLLVAFMCSALLHWERRNAQSGAFDYSGALIYTAVILCIAPALQNITANWATPALCAGLLTLVALTRHQLGKAHPLVEVRLLLENRRFSLVCLSMLGLYSATFSIPFAMTLFLQFVRELDPLHTGFILMLQALCTALAAPLGGRLTAKKGSRNIALAGLLCVTLSMILFATLTRNSPILMTYVALTLAGTGIGLFEPTAMHSGMEVVGETKRGSASALLNSTRMFGAFLGLGVVSISLSIWVGDTIISPIVYESLSLALRCYFGATLLMLTVSGLAIWQLCVNIKGSPGTD